MVKYCFGVDLGGTSVKLGLFDPEGTVLEKWEIPTRKDESGSKILPDIAKSILDKAAEKNISAQLVMQNYMLERLLERISLSTYKNNFILKGGFLISVIVGLDTRATMDLDTTIKGFTLTHESIRKVFKEI